jgi:hypothetical protein
MRAEEAKNRADKVQERIKKERKEELNNLTKNFMASDARHSIMSEIESSVESGDYYVKISIEREELENWSYDDLVRILKNMGYSVFFHMRNRELEISWNWVPTEE